MQHQDPSTSKKQRKDHQEEVFSFVGDEERIKQLEQALAAAREQISHLAALLGMEQGKTCHMDTIHKNMKTVLEENGNLKNEIEKLQAENERLKILADERYDLARFFKNPPPVPEDNSGRFKEKHTGGSIPNFYKKG